MARLSLDKEEQTEAASDNLGHLVAAKSFVAQPYEVRQTPQVVYCLIPIL